MSQIDNDKINQCVRFILECRDDHRKGFEKHGLNPPPPFFLGVNGVQGIGKTTLVSQLYDLLSKPPHNLPIVVLSIDDLYLTHEEQLALAKAHPSNPLVQHRGVPSTHDIAAGVQLFEDISNRASNIKIPSYDKSCFDGAGDRRPVTEWAIVNQPQERPIELVVFEGWCVAFRALDDHTLKATWQKAREEAANSPARYGGQLGRLEWENVHFLNEKLKDYDALTNRLDALIYLDAENISYVYDWRQESEAALRAAKGTGMTPDQVTTFVNGYYPAYELYTEALRKGGIVREDEEVSHSRQLRIVVGKDRRVKNITT